MEHSTNHHDIEKFSWAEFFKKETIAWAKLYFEPITITWSFLKKLYRRITQKPNPS